MDQPKRPPAPMPKRSRSVMLGLAAVALLLLGFTIYAMADRGSPIVQEPAGAAPAR